LFIIITTIIIIIIFRYCSRACQTKAWKTHKDECNNIKKVRKKKKQKIQTQTQTHTHTPIRTHNHNAIKTISRYVVDEDQIKTLAGLAMNKFVKPGWCLCVCMYVCMYVCICMCVCVCVCVCMCVCLIGLLTGKCMCEMYVCVCMCVYVRVEFHKMWLFDIVQKLKTYYPQRSKRAGEMYVCVCVCVCICVFVYMRECMCLAIYVCA